MLGFLLGFLFPKAIKEGGLGPLKTTFFLEISWRIRETDLAFSPGALFL